MEEAEEVVLSVGVEERAEGWREGRGGGPMEGVDGGVVLMDGEEDNREGEVEGEAEGEDESGVGG